MDEDAEVKEEKAIRAELAKKFLKDQLPLTSKAIDTEVKNRNAVVEGFVEQRMKAHADRIKQLRLRSQAEDDLNEVEQELSKELLAKTEKSDFIKMMTMLEDSKKKSIVVDENYAKARVFVKPYNFAADEPLEFKREEFRTQANTLANEEDYMASTRSRGQLITYAVTMVSNMIEEDNRLLREPPVSGKA